MYAHEAASQVVNTSPYAYHGTAYIVNNRLPATKAYLWRLLGLQESLAARGLPPQILLGPRTSRHGRGSSRRTSATAEQACMCGTHAHSFSSMSE